MNEPSPVPAPTPASTPLPPILNEPRPLGDDPAERAVIPNTFVAIEAILRHPRRLLFQMRQPGGGKLIAAMIFAALLCSVIYGVIVGTFSGGTQLWAAPVKIALGLMISAAICLPSLYIFACLSGSQARLIEVGGLLAGLLLLMTILLIGFAPVAWIFSQSTESVAWMGTLHLQILAGGHTVWHPLYEGGIFPCECTVAGGHQRLGGHLSARRAANDHRLAPHSGQV